MGCTSSTSADKDEDNAPYSKDAKGGPDPNTQSKPEFATTTTTSTTSRKPSSDDAKKGSDVTKQKHSKSTKSKSDQKNKEKEWGSAAERRAYQNQHTSTQMENFPTAPEYELKELIEQNKGRNAEFFKNAEAAGWKVSHIGDDGMVYLENQDTTKNGKQSKGNKVHLSDIKMPPPPDVPYHIIDKSEMENGVESDNINIEMDPENRYAVQYAAIGHRPNDENVAHGHEHSNKDNKSNTKNNTEGMGRKNASFADDDDVALRIEYINKDDISKEFIKGDSKDALNPGSNDHLRSQSGDSGDDHIQQNTVNYHLQNQMNSFERDDLSSSHNRKTNLSPGVYGKHEPMSGVYAVNDKSPTISTHNEPLMHHYSNEDEQPHQQQNVLTFTGESDHNLNTDPQNMNDHSVHKMSSNEPSVQFADSILQRTIMSDSLEFMAAIDLGYAYSGYAFMDINKPSQVEVNSNWASHLGFTSHKTPTALLFNSRDTVQAFGYHAFEKYDQLLNDDEGNMLLYKLAHSFKQKPQDKATWNLIATSMQYLKGECESVISKRYNADPKKLSINWSIPFPPDWDSRETMSSFKDHMYKVGFSKSSLTLLPDMECALHYCTTTYNMDPKDGNQCILISAGESAVHHYVYQYHKRKGWVCIHKVKSMGGQDVTRLFTKFLGYIFGDNFITELQRVHPSEWHNFINTFDLAKRDISTGMQLQVNYAFENFHREFSGGKTLKDVIHRKSKETGPSLSITKSGSLKFRQGTLIMLFESVLRDIEKKVQSCVEKYPNADTVFLVGGFGDCGWVKEKIRSASSQRKLVIPEEPNICVLKGAVLKDFMKK